MMNLIPPTGQKVIRREYLFRVGTTIGALLGVVFLILGVGCLPMYVLVDAQIVALSGLSPEHTDTESIARAEADIKEVKEIVAQLRSTKEGVSASEVLRGIESLEPGGVTFLSFTLGYVKEGIGKVTITGIASTREVLIRFKKALEADPQFMSADVPIADLAKDTNLPFTMTVTLSLATKP